LFLARQGVRVLLLDKQVFPRDKVCADNKTWKCLDIVRELGLWGEFEKLPKAHIRGVLVASPSGFELDTPLLPADVAAKGPWFNVRREVFDDLLVRAAKRESLIRVREGCTVARVLFEGKQAVGVSFLNENGALESVRCRVVVGADGSQSVVAHDVGLSSVVKGRFALNRRAYFEGVKGVSDRCELYYLKGVCPGYFWIFPVDGNRANVGIGMRVEDIGDIPLEKRLDELIATRFAGRFASARRVSEFGEWGLSVLGPRRACSGNGWVLVGDAGSFAMTFSGEGVGPSMRSGKIAALAVASALDRGDVSAKSLAEFDAALWRVLGPEVSGFRWLEFLLLHEGVFDFVIRRTARNPELIELSSRMQNDYSASRNLASLSTVWKLLFPKK
jgi:flavin-dependent dehydrogenase